jgi:hypothetical protein
MQTNDLFVPTNKSGAPPAMLADRGAPLLMYHPDQVLRLGHCPRDLFECDVAGGPHVPRHY